ncbi:hypothetical protein [Teredinibacter haidensis]|uniref:hypothetical protein n=1 Tax=Teredinibacter haidensis TaxID=2731755 RepID=UPI000948ABAF|nr:hypothetical protein [Teredinibacter haidensis]
MKLIIISFCLTALLLTGCVKQPTTSEITVDQRPAISFIPASKGQKTAEFEVVVDSLVMGRANEFINGEAALKLLSGTHLIQLIRNNEVVFSSTIYLGDGAIKSLPLPK